MQVEKPMSSTTRRYGKEEFARRGDTIYENDVRSHLRPEMKGSSSPSISRVDRSRSSIDYSFVAADAASDGSQGWSEAEPLDTVS